MCDARIDPSEEVTIYPKALTFESALRLLAEKEPLKFKVDGTGIMERICFQEDDGFFFSDATQDSVDEVLREIGWWYQIYSIPADGIEWKFEAFPVADGDGCDNGPYLVKLEAAKAALIAVVEKVYGETK